MKGAKIKIIVNGDFVKSSKFTRNKLNVSGVQNNIYAQVHMVYLSNKRFTRRLVSMFKISHVDGISIIVVLALINEFLMKQKIINVTFLCHISSTELLFGQKLYKQFN